MEGQNPARMAQFWGLPSPLLLCCWVCSKRDHSAINNGMTAAADCNASSPSWSMSHYIVPCEKSAPSPCNAAFCQNSLTTCWLMHSLCVLVAPCGPGTISPYPFTSPPCALSFSIFYFSFFPFLTLSIFLFFHPFPIRSIRIVPLRFQAGCHRRRLNLACFFLYLI